MVMPICCGGCPTCDCSATGTVLLGTPNNGSKTPLNSVTFPRWPRYSWTQNAVVPSVIMASRCARIFIYPCAIHNGSTYSVNDACRSVLTTGYVPNYQRKGNNHSPYDAYSVRSHRLGRDYDATSSDYRATILDDALQPNKLGSGANSLYGWLRGYGLVSSPFVPTSANLATIYGILAADLGGSMPAVGVPHTLLLYIRFWRETYKTLDWDGTSWPSWWTAQGINPDFRTASPAQGPPRTKDIQKNAFDHGAASDPTTEADSRAILFGAHILCTMPTAGSGINDPYSGLFGNPARDTEAFSLGAGLNQDLQVVPAYPNSVFLKPTTTDPGITIGDPFGGSDLYYVPLTFAGAGTWHLDFGGVRTVTVTLS
jgi:hypothetical protein